MLQKMRFGFNRGGFRRGGIIPNFRHHGRFTGKEPRLDPMTGLPIPLTPEEQRAWDEWMAEEEAEARERSRRFNLSVGLNADGSIPLNPSRVKATVKAKPNNKHHIDTSANLFASDNDHNVKNC